MIGGIVTKTKVLPDRIWVNCEEENSTSKCGIYVERNENSERIKPGDTVWWQAGYARWTPYEIRGKCFVEGLKQGRDYEVKIRKIGYSGVSEP